MKNPSHFGPLKHEKANFLGQKNYIIQHRISLSSAWHPFPIPAIPVTLLTAQQQSQTLQFRLRRRSNQRRGTAAHDSAQQVYTLAPSGFHCFGLFTKPATFWNWVVLVRTSVEPQPPSKDLRNARMNTFGDGELDECYQTSTFRPLNIILMGYSTYRFRRKDVGTCWMCANRDIDKSS